MEKQKINININKNVLSALDIEAKEKGLTRTAIIITLITDYLEKKGNKENEK